MALPSLAAEAAYWEDEYFKAYGVRVPSMIGMQVHEAYAIQSAVMRYWVEKMKEAIANVQDQ